MSPDTSGNVFERISICSRCAILSTLRQFKEFGITFRKQENARASTLPSGRCDSESLQSYWEACSENCTLEKPETHFGKFPVSADFQCWKANFKIELCSNSGCLAIAIWTKEVETANFVDDHLTQPTEVRESGNFEMLDARISFCIGEDHLSSALSKKSSR